MKLSTMKRYLRSFIKRFMYSQLAIMQGFSIAFGRGKPFIKFTVEADPPTIYLNFRIKDESVEELEKTLDLPEGFRLTKIKCLDNESVENYYITLNVYRVSGLVNGFRAEWSVYVKDLSDKVRYMIVEARSSKGSMDPIAIKTKKSTVEYTHEDNQIQILIASKEDTLMRIQCKIPPSMSTVMASKAWTEANDEIYWLNGVFDRTYYNGKMTCSNYLQIPAEFAKIEDSTKWKDFIDPEPEIVMNPSEIELLVSPWWNI